MSKAIKGFDIDIKPDGNVQLGQVHTEDGAEDLKEYTVLIEHTVYYQATVHAVDDDDAWEQGEELASAGEFDDLDYDTEDTQVYSVEEA
jgi:hypothetical protein|tara:strand:- start:237 stop:503 length:267 start_codon:yes stop_codon:yes gene_type:complete